MLSNVEAIIIINQVSIYVTKTNSLGELYNCDQILEVIAETSNIDCFTNWTFLSTNTYFSIKTIYDNEA